MPPTITRIATGHQQPEGDGMTVRRAFPNQSIGRLDPFLLLDEMGPVEFAPGARSGFPDHPHRGFETVTYLLDGEFEHKDSNGNKGRLRPGDVQWMTAGAGVVHSEMPSSALRQKGGRLHGFQLWVNLPKVDKMMTPRYQEFPGAKIPTAKFPGGWAKVIAGRFGGVSAVIDTRTPIQYLHVQLDAGTTVQLPIPAGHEGFVYVFQGEATVAGKQLKEAQTGALAGIGDLGVEAGPGGAQFLFVTGIPVKEPVFQYGPFVMTSRDEILQAVQDFQDGKFGTIPATH